MMTSLIRNTDGVTKRVWRLARPVTHSVTESFLKTWTSKPVPYLWFAWVGVLSLLPGELKAGLHTRGTFHVPAHALVFALSALMACRSVKGTLGRVVPCLVVIGYGCLLEALQSLISRSQFEWDDLATDACGVVVAFLLATWVDGIRKARQGTCG